MARILITGSSDGLGQMAARLLVEEGHSVVLHARNEARAASAIEQVPGAETVLFADLSSIAETKALAERINALGDFDAIIHNAGVGYQEPKRIATVDGLPHVFAVNALAPYILTALVKRPQRLIYVSSKLHRNGDPSLQDLTWEQRPWDGTQAYSDAKLHNVLLAFAVARRWPEVLSNGLEPGWVPTKMGGASAPDDLDLAPRTQAWLAAGIAAETQVTGGYFYHQRPAEALKAAFDTSVQERFISACAELSGVVLPQQ
ncbi:SDR family NAD(P)-dependent oxidoreductase [Pseudomonas gingeri]|uniref:SDR family NAD(P)-dependent oxidoreductase n=1 Tax=Pseudomonas gingeri TaxID=117681 RepID=UPI0015A26DCB|nr:SDR family NAD(P)-dependent oxidoreductase [Pseudomonas gingeri]NWA24980.1 SDR family NAD(P)-dependent oxidoreductase [Pseudomonas gingeri]NWD71812.1 SDR family NAD(P)-dependent oxidoreductase [Pseudomonas gingeri]NWD77716.1 SDR family NAD(P)-dependent oxidoreductase [Pseudomonas gingeri]